MPWSPTRHSFTRALPEAVTFSSHRFPLDACHSICAVRLSDSHGTRAVDRERAIDAIWFCLPVFWISCGSHLVRALIHVAHGRYCTFRRIGFGRSRHLAQGVTRQFVECSLRLHPEVPTRHSRVKKRPGL